MLMRSKGAPLFFVALLALGTSESQAQTRFPEMDELRAWIEEHQPKLAAGDSGINAAIIVIDTAAKYVKSVAFRLSERELATMDPMAHAATIQDDTTIKRILYSCMRSENEGPGPTKPMCSPRAAVRSKSLLFDMSWSRIQMEPSSGRSSSPSR